MTKTNKELFVSVIIPNYKREYKLKRALLSVLSQTYPFLEVLVVDDCSPNIEKIIDLLKSINDQRIVLLKHDVNKGGGAARNTGILNAKGKYIAFLDSDDTWECAKLEKQVSISENYSEEILCYTKSTVFTDNWTKQMPKRGIFENETISEYLFLKYEFLPTPSILVTTSLAKKCLFDESLPRHQDYDFLFKLEQQKVKIIFIDEALTNVIWTKVENLTKKGWNSEFSKKFFDSYRKYMGEKSYANAFFNSVIYTSIKNESRIKSLKYIFNNYSLLCYVKRIVLIKYLVRLILGR